MYPDYPYFAVAITRTCGSGGGSYIGKQLAKAFDIDLYDRKLLRLASEDSGISEELFARADENTRKTMLYRVSERVYDGSIIPPESGNFISDENLFNYQAKVLRELLNEESYICVGRAADFVLRDKPNVLTVYVDAPYDWRVEREMKRQGIGSSQAKHYIDKLDRYRESYYKYHTGRQWKRVENYDLSKAMFFPVWLALLHVLHLPYLVSGAALWCAASLLAAFAFAPLWRNAEPGCGRVLTLGLFGALAFLPSSWAAYTLRVYRDNIFPALCLVFFAGMAGMALRAVFYTAKQKPLCWRWQKLRSGTRQAHPAAGCAWSYPGPA